MRNPFALLGRHLWRNRNFYLKAVNAAAVVAIVAGYSSWAAQAAEADARTQAEAVQAERSQTRGAYDTDGTFEGSAQGYGGTVTCRVTIENGYIESVEVTDHAGETPPTLRRPRASRRPSAMPREPTSTPSRVPRSRVPAS